MSRIAVLAMIVALGCASSAGAADPSVPDPPFGLSQPVRLLSAGYFEDGGTVGFVLVSATNDTLRGGFDGRMQRVGAVRQSHCYLGARYPTDPGAVLLPLRGREERALVDLLDGVIRDSLSSEETNALLVTTTAMKLPKNISVDLWHLVRRVHGLRQREEAADQGLLAGRDETLRFFELVEPLRADSIALDETAHRFVIRVTDAKAENRHVFFPASLDSVMASSYWEPGSTLRIPAGQPEDRLSMTLLSLALGSEPDTVGDAKVRQCRTDLRALLGTRTSRILEADARE